MRVFLTGATGYIGSVVAEKLQAAGHTVDEAKQHLGWKPQAPLSFLQDIELSPNL